MLWWWLLVDEIHLEVFLNGEPEVPPESLLLYLSYLSHYDEVVFNKF